MVVFCKYLLKVFTLMLLTRLNEAVLGSGSELVQRCDFMGIAIFLDLAGNLGEKMAAQHSSCVETRNWPCVPLLLVLALAD